MKEWLLPIAVVLTGCMVMPGEPRPGGHSRWADDSANLLAADNEVLRILAETPGCSEKWRGKKNWKEGLVFRVAPVPPQYAAVNFCNKRNRVYVSLLHIDDMDAAELARIIIHESQHQAYCDDHPGDEWDKEESEKYAMAAEAACFPDLTEDMEP